MDFGLGDKSLFKLDGCGAALFDAIVVVFTQNFTKKVRKGRYADYEKSLEVYEAARAEADAKFKNDNRAWSARRAEYDRTHAQQNGRVLLKSALATSATENVNVRIRIPEGKKPGDPLDLFYKNQQYRVQVPANAVPGQEVTIVIPQPVNVAIAYTPSVSQQPPAYAQPAGLGIGSVSGTNGLRSVASHAPVTSEANGLAHIPSAPPAVPEAMRPTTTGQPGALPINSPNNTTTAATSSVTANNSNHKLPRVNSFDFI